MKRYIYLLLTLVLMLCSLKNIRSQCTVSASASSVDVLCGDTVKLAAIGSGILAFRNNFNCGQVQCPEGDPDDPNSNFGSWSNSSTAQFDNPCLPDHPSGTPHIWFNNASPSPRVLATEALDLSTGGSVVFDMRFADPDLNGNQSPCENPDAAAEGVHLQYSLDNGGTWTDIAYYGPGNGNDPVRTVWTTYEEVIPDAAFSNSTLIRWAQLANSGTLADNLDHWGLDNCEVIRNPPNAVYTWQHTGVGLPNGSTPDVVPTNTTTYSVEYNDGTNVCTDDVTVNVRRQTMTVNVSPDPPICPGETVTLDADAEIDIPVYNCGPTNDCQGSTRSIDLGLGNLTNNNYQALGIPGGGGLSLCTNGEGNYAQFARTQFIILASEFPAFLQGGQIYQLELNSATAGSWANFTISMGCTDKAEFASTAESEFITGLTEVYTPKGTDLQDGWNEIALDQKYEWDAQSNLVVQICWHGAQASGQFRKTATGGQTVLHTHSCSDMGCNGYLAGNAVTDNNRPSFKVDMCYRIDPQLEYEWTPTAGLSDPNDDRTDASPTETTTYVVEVRDANAPPQCAVRDSIQVGILSLDGFDADFVEPWCEGQDLELIAGITGADNYDWVGPNGFTSTDENPVIPGAGLEAEGTYTVTASNGTCSGESSVVVSATLPGTAGTPRDTSICNASGSYNLFNSLLGEDGGGNWLDDDNSGILTSPTLNLTALDPTTLPQTFAYTYELTDDCGTYTETVNVTINPQLNAGANNSTNVCETLGTLDLNTLLGANADANGRWEDPDGTNQLTDNNLNTTDLGFGAYEFWYIQESSAPCENDTAFISVTIQNQPDAGTDGSGALCTGGTIDLFPLLGGTPDNTGEWEETTTSGGTLTGSTFNTTDVLAGTYSFTYTIEAETPCIEVSSIVTITVFDTPVMENVTVTCNEGSPGYVITFDISGGDPSSYTVDYPGTLNGNSYTSDDIPSDTEVTINLSDGNNCGITSTTINKKCDCVTRASDMRTDTTVIACEGDSVQGIILGGFVDDGNDVEKYYLHDNNGPSLGTLLDSNETAKFGFVAGMNYNQTYYISSAAANDAGNGFPEKADACLETKSGTPVIFYRNPYLDISLNPNPICPGDESIIFGSVEDGMGGPINGNGPFDVDFTFDGGGLISLTAVNANFTDTVSQLDTTTFTVATIRDANGCVGTGNSATLFVNEAPTAVLSTGSGCGIANSTLDISVGGAGSSWTVTYTNDLDNTESTLVMNSNGFSGPPPVEDPNSPVTYSLVSVSDNSGSVCPGVVQGTYTVNPIPTATLLGIDSVYCQGNNVDFTLDATGIGPWDIVLSDGAGGTYNTSISSGPTTVTVPQSLTPGNYTFTIASVTDRNTGCTGTFSGSADVTINPGPAARVGFNLASGNTPVDKRDTICLGDAITYDFEYLGGADPITVNFQVDNEAPSSLTLSSSNPIDSRTYTSGSFLGNIAVTITSVTDNTAAGCVGGTDAATIHVKNLPQVSVNMPSAICDGGTVTVDYSISTGEGNVSFDIVENGSGTVVASVSDPVGNGYQTSFPAPAPGSYTYSIQNVTDQGVQPCGGTNNNTFNLDVQPLPSFNINTADLQVCEGDVVLVPYIVTGTADFDISYMLTNTQSGQDTPMNEIVNGSGNMDLGVLPPGTYVLQAVSVTETSGLMCSNNGVGSKNILVNPNPSITNLSFSPNPVCAGASTTFSFTLNGGGPWDVTYNNGLTDTNVVTSNAAFTSNPFYPTNNRTFSVNSITNTLTGCTADNLPQTADLTVGARPSIDFISGELVCEGGIPNVTYTITNGQGASSFSLRYEDQNGMEYNESLNSESGSFGFNGLGINDSLRLTPIEVSTSACSGSGTGFADVISKPNPAVVIQYSSLADCAPFEPLAYFTPETNYDSRTANWYWTENGSVSNVDTLRPNLSATTPQANVQLNLTSIHGCSNSASQTFSLNPDPVANFYFSPEKPTILNSEVSFVSTSSQDAAFFTWFLDDTLVGNSNTFGIGFPNEQDIYEMCLAVENIGGCVDTLCVDVPVTGDLSVYIPSAFTPDGDGINDVFLPVVNRALEGTYIFQIFNRWGELVFETNKPGEGWTGNTLKGGLAMPGIYAYRITLASDFDAQEIFSENGTVLLTK